MGLCDLGYGSHNPEAAGSSPASATKSVTVVDTISTTVIFYLLPFWGCFGHETVTVKPGGGWYRQELDLLTKAKIPPKPAAAPAE